MTEPTIRLVVTDLDGTLLNPDREISQAAVDAVARLKERGIRFTFITGRPPYAVQRFAQRVGTDAPIVCCNGAVICDGKEVLQRHSFSLVLKQDIVSQQGNSSLRSIMEEAAELGMTVLLYTRDTEYTLCETDWSRKRDLPLWHFPTEASAGDETIAEKVNFISAPGSRTFLALTPRIQALAQSYCIAFYGSFGCEIVAKEVNKATGLAALCELCGVPIGQALAIGDNENDIHMLQAAGIGAAVANATESAKAAADYLCRECHTDGVVEAIQKFALKGDGRT